MAARAASNPPPFRRKATNLPHEPPRPTALDIYQAPLSSDQASFDGHEHICKPRTCSVVPCIKGLEREKARIAALRIAIDYRVFVVRYVQGPESCYTKHRCKKLTPRIKREKTRCSETKREKTSVRISLLTNEKNDLNQMKKISSKIIVLGSYSVHDNV